MKPIDSYISWFSLLKCLDESISYPVCILEAFLFIWNKTKSCVRSQIFLKGGLSEVEIKGSQEWVREQEELTVWHKFRECVQATK